MKETVNVSYTLGNGNFSAVLMLHFPSSTKRESLITQILFKHRPWLKAPWKGVQPHSYCYNFQPFMKI